MTHGNKPSSFKPTMVEIRRDEVLECYLLEKLGLRDCLVLILPEIGPQRRGVLFVEQAEALAGSAWLSRLDLFLPDDFCLEGLCALPSFPRTEKGEYDLEALARQVTLDRQGHPTPVPQWETGESADLVLTTQDPEIPMALSVMTLLKGETSRAYSAFVNGQLSPQRKRSAASESTLHNKPAYAKGEILPPSSQASQTLLGALKRAATMPKGYFFTNGKGQVERVSYAVIQVQASRVAAGMARAGIGKGDTVILQCETGKAFITAFWACVWLGAVPAPLAVGPSYRQKSHATAKLQNTWSLLDAPAILCEQALKADLVSFGESAHLPGWQVFSVEELRLEEAIPAHAPQPQDLALLLVTSGSTGTPKVVPQTHHSLLQMTAATIHMNRFTSEDATYNWMPLDHVGALVFLGLMSVDLGADQHHAPIHFILQNPMRWIRALSQTKATISWAPNFAFGLILGLERQLQEEAPDLSAMRFLVNAGEAVAAKTMRDFVRLLERFGLPSLALRPAFGMSETCSGITWSKGFSLDDTRDDDRFVNLGPVIPNTEMRIVNGDGLLLSEGDIGSVQFRGPSVTKGYFQNPELNQDLFSAEGWFTTGDLGFIRDACLFITGREKDEIVINGTNYYCHEIEVIAESVPGVVASYTAASAVTLVGEFEEKLALFFHAQAETPWELQNLMDQIRGTLSKQMGLQPDFLIPLPADMIPKTGIGKIQRTQLRRSLEQGAFDDLLRQLGMPPWSARLLPACFATTHWQEVRGRKRIEATPKRVLGWVCDKAALASHCAREFPELVATWEVFNSAAMNLGLENLKSHLTEALETGCFPTDLVFWPGSAAANASETLLDRATRLVEGLSRWIDLVQTHGVDLPAMTLWVLSEQAFSIDSQNPGDPVQSLLQGLVATIDRECPRLKAILIDAEAREIPKAFAAELMLHPNRSLVAYRKGVRYQSVLRGMTRFENQNGLLIKPGGRYVITGGLGVLGSHLGKFLLQAFQAKLLIIGSTALDETGSSAERSHNAERLRHLRHLSADVHYQPADVSQEAVLEAAVAQFERSMGGPIDGVFHLASQFSAAPLGHHSSETIRKVLGSKWLGGLNCLGVLKARGQGFLVQFSSINSWWGGSQLGTFAAACSGCDALTSHEIPSGVRVQTLAWSPWELCGFSRENGMNTALSAAGFATHSLAMGLGSLLLAMQSGQKYLHVGVLLQGTALASFAQTPASPTALQVYATAAPAGDQNLVLHNTFGASVPGRVYRVTSRKAERELRKQAGKTREPGGPASEKNAISKTIADIWRLVLGLADIGIQDNFFELGGHSLSLIQVHARLQEAFGRDFPLVVLFQNATIAALTQFFASTPTKSSAVLAGLSRAGMRRKALAAAASNGDIAVIGMSCRFPGASDVATFWENLRRGAMTITPLTERQLEEAGIDPRSYLDRNYVKWMPQMERPGHFDAAFFGYSAKEAELMDPQQRIMLEVAWEAMEDAGYPPGEAPLPVGVFAGATTNTYLMNNVMPNRNALDTNDDLFAVTLDSMGGFQLMVANDKDYLTTRVSYKLNLSGPSINIQTACSTSLVAVHQACQSLLAGECDMALAGGITVNAPEHSGHLFQEGMIVTPDGMCRAFDAKAEGTIFGSGAGAVLLKRLDQAMADGDHIYAVVKGTACNNDGGTKVGYMAPSGDGQASTVAEALEMAQVDPATVTFLEAHGTGTPIGDPIEFNGLATAFREFTQRKGYCALGAVKTNLGHLQIASGIVGFMKAALCLKHQMLVPTLHFEQPNPAIDLESSPFFVPTSLQEWTPVDEKGNRIPRRAGVNSLGIGGTNAHAILEEPPPRAASEHVDEVSPHLFTLSAKTPKALAAYARAYIDFLDRNPQASLGDMCYSQNIGRRAFETRLALVLHHRDELREALSLYLGGSHDVSHVSAQKAGDVPRVAWIFTGQGEAFGETTRDLYAQERIFREAIDRCAALADPYLRVPLKTLLFESSDSHTQTDLAQPGIVALAFALGELWKSWGLQPGLVLGHSVGEFAAAVEAGVFTIEEALRLVIVRGQAMQAELEGQMASIQASELQVRAWLQTEPALAVAAINGRNATVICGPPADLLPFLDQLKQRKIKTHLLQSQRAFHGSSMYPAALATFKAARGLVPKPTKIPLVANLSGMFAGSDFAQPSYWYHHACLTVRFSESLQTLSEWQPDLVIEIGPKPVLLGLLANHLHHHKKQPQLLPSLRPNQAARVTLLESLGKAYLAGVTVRWKNHYQGVVVRKIPVPTYPFQGQRYWLPAATRHAAVSMGDPFPNSSLYRQNRFSSPVSDYVVYQNTWSLEKQPWFKDHRIGHQVLVPGAAFMEGIFDVASHEFACDGVTLENAVLATPLIFSESLSHSVQFALTPSRDSSQFQVLSAIANSDKSEPNEWLTHFSGTLSSTPGPFAGEPLVALKSRFQEMRPGEDAHWRVIQRGIEVGPAFQCIQRFSTLGRETLAFLTAPTDHLPSFALRTSLLDSALQTLLVTLGDEIAQETIVPFQIDALRLMRHAQASCWVHCVLQDSDQPDTLVANMVLYGEDGSILGTLTGFRARKLAENQQKLVLSKARRWHYALAWEPTDSSRSMQTASSWLIFSSRADQLKKMVRQSTNLDLCILPWPDRDHRAAVLKQLTAQPNRIILLDLNLSHPDHLNSDWEKQIELLFHSLQGLLTAAESKERPIYWLGSDGFSLQEGQAVNPLSTAMAGWVQTLHQEDPDRTHVYLDSGEGVPLSELLMQEANSNDKETWVAYRRANHPALQRMVPRLKSQEFSLAPLSEALDVSCGYLLVGGLRGLGWETACSLVAHGVRNLLLIGRRPPDPEVSAHLDSWKNMGIRVETLAIDITQHQNWGQIERRFTSMAVRLGGIYLAAGVLDDGAFQNLGWHQFRSVLAPKIAGAQWVAQFCEHQQPDFVLFFGSIAGILGSAGQTAYATANMYLDGMAALLTAKGIPASVVHWGPWREVGMAHDKGLLAKLQRQGLDAIPTETGLELIHALSRQVQPRRILAPIQWQTYGSTHRSLPLLADLQKSRRAPLPAPPNGSAQPTSLEDVANLVSTLLQDILGTQSGEDAQLDKGFFDLGLDSLSSVDLRNRLQQRIGKNLPQTLAFDYPTPEALIAYVYETFFSEQSNADREASARFSQSMAAPLPDTSRVYEELSEEDAAAQLDARLAEIDRLLEGV